MTIRSFKLIRWFPLYITASQMVSKVDDKAVVVSAVEVFEGLVGKVLGLVPEILDFIITNDTGILHDIRDLAVLRGGIVEYKELIREQKVLIESLERDKKFLIEESEKLVILMEDYQKLVKQHS